MSASSSDVGIRAYTPPRATDPTGGRRGKKKTAKQQPMVRTVAIWVFMSCLPLADRIAGMAGVVRGRVRLRRIRRLMSRRGVQAEGQGMEFTPQQVQMGRRAVTPRVLALRWGEVFCPLRPSRPGVWMSGRSRRVADWPRQKVGGDRRDGRTVIVGQECGCTCAFQTAPRAKIVRR